MAEAARVLPNLVGGEWVAALDGATMDVVDPATGGVVARVPAAGAADVDRAVEAARRAFPAWGETSPRARGELLLRLAAAVEEHGEELAALESRNVGKPLPAARIEIEKCADCLRFFAGAARMLQGPVAGEYEPGFTSMIRREPIGVVAGIAPWNYPLMMAVWKLGPALAAGNVQVIKPSEQTPLTLLRFAELVCDLVPAGVLNVVTGDGPSAGAALAAHADVGMVSLTGDVGTGQAVARAAAGNLKRVHLELGGKAPVLVFDDADLDAVAEELRTAAFWNSGQDCTAASRVIAARGIYDDLVELLVPVAESVRTGDPAGGDVDMGPVISLAQQERVLGFVERASDGGASVLTGGRPLGERGFFVEPTVVAGVSQADEIVQREVFGPVVTVQRFESDEEAIGWANGVEYGLAASVWTENVDRALGAARRLQFGAVWINAHMRFATEMPHGGFKRSGYGKDLSIYSVEDYTQVKHVMARTA